MYVKARILSISTVIVLSSSCLQSNNTVPSTSSADTSSDETTDSTSQGQFSPGSYGVEVDDSDPCGMVTAFNLDLSSDNTLGIVGGKAVSAGDLTSRSTVKVIFPTGYCTGTLIGPNQIVTAAHCFQDSNADSTVNNIIFITDPSDVSIGLGLGGAENSNLRVTSFLPHPNYRGIYGPSSDQFEETIFYDVALISFSGTLPSGYQPVTIGESNVEAAPNTRVIVAGYGAYTDTDRASRPLSSVETQIAEVNAFREIQLQINGKGACYGDSGGPTYVYPEDLSCLKLVGSTTGPGRDSDFTCNDGSGTMMDITRYRGWIKCSLEQMGLPLDYLPSDDSAAECSGNAITR